MIVAKRNVFVPDGVVMTIAGVPSLIIAAVLDLAKFITEQIGLVGVFVVAGLYTVPVAGVALAVFLTEAVLWIKSHSFQLSAPRLPTRAKKTTVRAS